MYVFFQLHYLTYYLPNLQLMLQMMGIIVRVTMNMFLMGKREKLPFGGGEDEGVIGIDEGE